MSNIEYTFVLHLYKERLNITNHTNEIDSILYVILNDSRRNINIKIGVIFMYEQFYDKNFYANQKTGSLQSAKIVVPIIMNLIQPKNIIDIGCGVGTWLSVFKDLGCDILGLDGSWVNHKQLEISPEYFSNVNLEEKITLNKTFDLVVSLEVAEHLKKERAESFIRDLTSLGPVILFSAAIPFQGGKNHLNEQWQSYWAEIFFRNNYIPIDCIRPLIWHNPNVKLWYKQNTVLYCRKDCIENYPELKGFPSLLLGWQLWDLVHPEMFLLNQNLKTYVVSHPNPK